MDLNGRQIAFINEYLKDYNATRAAIAAGYSPASAHVQGFDLLKHPRISVEIEKRKAIVAAEAKLEIGTVVRAITSVLVADPRELMELRRIPCRYCNGDNHLYQFSPEEMRQAYIKWMKEPEPKLPFDMKGGDGYRHKGDPHPDCPECGGIGIEQAYFKDSRDLSPDAAALYVGVKTTKNGIEVMTRDKDAAIKQAALYLGMNKQTIDVALTKKPNEMTDEELAAIAMGGVKS